MPKRLDRHDRHENGDVQPEDLINRLGNQKLTGSVGLKSAFRTTRLSSARLPP